MEPGKNTPLPSGTTAGRTGPWCPDVNPCRGRHNAQNSVVRKRRPQRLQPRCQGRAASPPEVFPTSVGPPLPQTYAGRKLRRILSVTNWRAGTASAYRMLNVPPRQGVNMGLSRDGNRAAQSSYPCRRRRRRIALSRDIGRSGPASIVRRLSQREDRQGASLGSVRSAAPRQREHVTSGWSANHLALHATQT